MEGVVAWALEEAHFTWNAEFYFPLRVKYYGEQLAPLPDILFSQNAFNWNCEKAILLPIVQKSYNSVFKVDTIPHSPWARVISYARGI
jgi:hypothetical protein